MMLKIAIFILAGKLYFTVSENFQLTTIIATTESTIHLAFEISKSGMLLLIDRTLIPIHLLFSVEFFSHQNESFAVISLA